MYLEHCLSALLQLHHHSRLNTWLQWIGQKQLRWDEKHLCFWFGATYTKGLTIYPWHLMLSLGHKSVRSSDTLTLNVQRPSYLGLSLSISWLLMPWLLSSPGHQQPWYWLYRIQRSLSYLRKDFKYLCHINVLKWHKMYVYVYVPSEKFST